MTHPEGVVLHDISRLHGFHGRFSKALAHVAHHFHHVMSAKGSSAKLLD